MRYIRKLTGRDRESPHVTAEEFHSPMDGEMSGRTGGEGGRVPGKHRDLATQSVPVIGSGQQFQEPSPEKARATGQEDPLAA